MTRTVIVEKKVSPRRVDATAVSRSSQTLSSTATAGGAISPTTLYHLLTHPGRIGTKTNPRNKQIAQENIVQDTSAAGYRRWCVAGLAGVLLVISTCTPVFAQNRPQLDVDRFVRAVYVTEGGSAAKWLYGIRSVHYADAAEAKHICENTVRNNWQRWHKAGCPGDFTSFIGNRYCPASTDPTGHRNWLANIRKLYGEI